MGHFVSSAPAVLRILATAAICVALLHVPSLARAADKPRAVVELFTSQGCSSCPAADRILAEYAKRGDVLALSWHVDYWNYLGWRDTFSKAAFTDRQQRYAASFQRRGVYTPQAVVNGRTHAVGSHHREIENLITSYARSGKGLTVPVTTRFEGESVRITAGGVDGKATLWIVYFDRRIPVKILRGENRGRTITYHNVVRDFTMLGMTKDGAVDITLPLDEMKRKGFDSCALLLQKATAAGTPGPIVGAAVIGELGS